MADFKQSEFTEKQLILQRWQSLKVERSSWLYHWADITAFLLPRNGRYVVSDHNKGWRRHNQIFDNTATRALNVLAAGLMGGLTSPARPWFRLGVSDQGMMQSAPVKLWLAQCTELMLEIFQKSNVYRVLHGMYKELGAFGTACAIIVEDYNNVIHLYPLTIGEYALATDWKGQVCAVYREFEKTVAELVKEFGYDNCSNAVQTLYDRGTLDKWVGVVHAIEPREDRDLTKRDAANMGWKSVYYETGGRPDKALRESGFKSFRVLAPRWDVAGGDIYGNSPGMEALGDIKQLQQQQLRKAQAIDYQSNPPLQVPAGLKNRDVDRFPGGITFTDGAGNGNKIETMFQVNLDISHLAEDMQEVRQRINSSFYADMFLMLQGDSLDAQKTATEVAELHEEKMLMIGPVLERLHNELLSPLINTTFDMMVEARIVPPPPSELQGMPLNVELISVLAQAQRAITTNGVDRFMQNVVQLSQVNPELLDKVDFDYWADSYSDMLGVDPQLIVAADKVQAIRQARAKAQAAAQKAQMANAQADTAQKAAGAQAAAAQTNQPPADIMGMFSGYNSQGA